MSLLPFTAVPPYRPRRFVPAELNPGDWSQLAPLFDQLETRAAQGKTVADFERWLLDWGEVSAMLDEEGSQRHIATTCHTDDPVAERAYLDFIEQIEPKLKPRQFKLAEIYVQHPLRRQLPQPRYAMFDRDTAVTVELFRPANIPLETEETKVGQEYSKLSGALTVPFRGEEKTLVQMARYQEETDRALRQETWELVANRRLKEADKFEAQFDQLLKLREKIATNAGFANYRDYAFRLRRRFDYTPADCTQFHDTIAGEFMPLVRQLQAKRRRQLKLPALRPWDLAVDPLGRPPLHPFERADQLETGTQKIFDRLDPALGAGFRELHAQCLLDLANRKGKRPGGYQSSLAETRRPFIFMNAIGVQRDVDTLLHEAGHAFHALACREEDFFAYRNNIPLEFCEVASMSMELLGADYLDVFYPNAADARRARCVHLETIIGLFPWIATVDAFQHWMYTHPGHSAKERRAAWLALMDRFGGDVDWTGYENARAQLWHRQLHIFLYPFYYIEYGLAQIGALQVWANSKRDRAAALRAYRQALALGGSQPLPALFAAAGTRFDFHRATLRPLVELIQKELLRETD